MSPKLSMNENSPINNRLNKHMRGNYRRHNQLEKMKINSIITKSLCGMPMCRVNREKLNQFIHIFHCVCVSPLTHTHTHTTAKNSPKKQATALSISPINLIILYTNVNYIDFSLLHLSRIVRTVALGDSECIPTERME